MDTNALRYFRDAAAAGSLSLVARTRGMAVSTVARRLDAIESELGLTLLDRGRDGVTATPQGQRILALVEPLLAEADRLSRIADAMRHDRRQHIVVTATEFVVSEILAPALSKFPADLRLDLRSQAAVVSLAGREADLAIRMSPPQGASLITRKLPIIRLGLFCSEAYLAGRDPQTLVLSAERLLSYDDSYGRIPELGWVSGEGAAAATVRTNSTRGLVVMASAGAGIAILPAAFARKAGLIELKPTLPLPARTPWLVTHADLKRQPDIRRVHRWIVAAFKEA